jgi:glycogen debranching enzyme
MGFEDPLTPKPDEIATTRTPQFFIAGNAPLQERRPRTLKHGDTFAIFDHNGDVLSGSGSLDGMFHRDTRYLSHFMLTVRGERPLLLSSALRDDNALLIFDLANPDLEDSEGNIFLQHDRIHIRRTRFIWRDTCFERLSLHNFDEHTHQVPVEMTFAADFADLFEVRGTDRKRRGTYNPPVVEDRKVVLSYTGLDGVRRQTILRFDEQPDELTEDRAVYNVELEPGQTKQHFIEIACQRAPAEMSPRRQYFSGLREARREAQSSLRRAAAVISSNDIFNEAIRRSMADLYMLVTRTEHGPYPYAGIPWFSTVFGRDALITAAEVLWMDPSIAKGVLRHLAANQATEEDPEADAEPGKILHEVRYGEMAELKEVPFRRYYGSVDSTPLFIMLAGAYFERTNDIETVRELWPNIKAALEWVQKYGDRDGDGFVEYGRRTTAGLANQGWKDSWDAVFHANGELARGPIALCELQAYVYAAWKAARKTFEPGSTRFFSIRNSGPMCWRWTGTSAPAVCGRPTRGMRC